MRKLEFYKNNRMKGEGSSRSNESRKVEWYIMVRVELQASELRCIDTPAWTKVEGRVSETSKGLSSIEAE